MSGELKMKTLYRRLHTATAYDWEEEKNKNKNKPDDGTMSFFWRAHTLTVLVIFICILVYVAVFEVPSSDSEYNMKRGIAAVVLAFLLFGVTQSPDGPFRRPHPAFWRLILCLSIVYESAMVYLLFQTPDDARKLLTHFDSTVVRAPIVEKNYGLYCVIYDFDNIEDPLHNVWDVIDIFFFVHFVGWYFKTLIIIRDLWFSMALSILFELSEYSHRHVMNNFSECWWDHWFLDVVLCNGLGIYLGMVTLDFLSIKPYNWRGLWNINTNRGRWERAVPQITHHSRTYFKWRPVSSLIRWFACLGILFMFLVAEMNYFYLKRVLWLPVAHYLLVIRALFFVIMGGVSLRETFQYLDDPTCKEFGRQSWLLSAIIITELLVAFKYGLDIFNNLVPTEVVCFWIIGFIGLMFYTIWKFYIKRDVKNDLVPEIKRTLSYDKAVDE